MEPGSAPELRSLTIGEIFDRATTMYVRNFSVFTLIVLTLLAPLAVLRYILIGKFATESLAQIMDAIQHPTAPHPALAAAGSAAAGLFVVFLLTTLLAPYVYNALAAGVAMIYRGETPTYAPAFRRVLSRGWSLLGTTVLCFLVIFAIYIGIAFFLIFVVALAAAIVGSAGAAVLVVLLIGALLMVVGLVLAVLACVFATYATTLEGVPAGQAIAQAFGRIFNRREFGKAVLVTLAWIALELIALVVSGGISLFLESVVRSLPLDLTFSTIAGAVLNAYVTTLLAVYYFDVRTRFEGLDLEVDIARLSPS
jgi:hypothetical protein